MLLFMLALAEPPSPVDSHTVVSGPFEQGPNYLRDATALAALPGKIHEACGWTGRIKFLSLGRDHTAIALAEIEGHGLDSVVFAWGQVVRTPVPQTEEEVEELKRQAFRLEPHHLAMIPEQVERALQASPHETVVERVNLLGIGGAPRMEIELVHPRKVLDKVVIPLK